MPVRRGVSIALIVMTAQYKEHLRAGYMSHSGHQHELGFDAHIHVIAQVNKHRGAHMLLKTGKVTAENELCEPGCSLVANARDIKGARQQNNLICVQRGRGKGVLRQVRALGLFLPLPSLAGDVAGFITSGLLESLLVTFLKPIRKVQTGKLAEEGHHLECTADTMAQCVFFDCVPSACRDSTMYRRAAALG
jgi:hypothetical protein